MDNQVNQKADEIISSITADESPASEDANKQPFEKGPRRWLVVIATIFIAGISEKSLFFLNNSYSSNCVSTNKVLLDQTTEIIP